MKKYRAFIIILNIENGSEGMIFKKTGVVISLCRISSTRWWTSGKLAERNHGKCNLWTKPNSFRHYPNYNQLVEPVKLFNFGIHSRIYHFVE